MVMMRSRPLLRLTSSLPLLFLLFALAGSASHAADLPEAKAATEYPAHDVHAKEQVAIAVEPFDTPDKCKVFQADYLKYRFMPFRIIVTNEGDRPVSLKDARIYFISATGERIPAAEPDDIERRVGQRDSRGRDIPIGPIKIHTKGKDSDSKIEQDFDRLEYAALAVEPHTTRAGFLFYDMDGLGKRPLRDAKMVFRELRNADGQELFYFEVPFNKYLDAKH